MHRLGLGAADLTRANPRLIYCSLPGLRRDDPRARMAAWEGVVSAAADIYHPVREIFGPADGSATRPTFTAIPLASNFAGFHAATSIVMALIARQRPAAVNRSKSRCSMRSSSYSASRESRSTACIRSNRRARTAADATSAPTAAGSSSRRPIRSSGYGLPAAPAWTSGQPMDCSTSSGSETEPDLRKELRQRLTALFRTRPALEWEKLANQAGSPMSMIRSAAEWIGTEHARSWGSVIQLDDPVLGPTWMAGLHVHLTDSPGEARPRRLARCRSRRHPRRARRTRRQLPRDAPLQSELALPLEGISILDLTQVVAGPCAGRILVEYGADVIKISNPRARDVPAEFSTSGMAADPGNQQHEHLNRGKQTLRLDLQSDAGLDVFWKLVDQADVVMQNFPLGTAERYGISYEQVHSRKPDAVYFSLSAFGYTGPWAGSAATRATRKRSPD